MRPREQRIPEAGMLAVASRQFLTRAVWYLAEHEITQYVDLVVSHALTDEPGKDAISAAGGLGGESEAQGLIPRSAGKVSEFFTGLGLVEPGLASRPRWHPDEPGERTEIRFLGGVSGKPGDQLNQKKENENE